VSDECFVPEVETELVPGQTDVRVTKESRHKVVYTSEENYVFDLSAVKSDLVNWIDKDESIHPKVFRKPLENLVSSELGKLSVSRPASRLRWGVPVPGDDSQVIYVWLDALVNYLTVAGYPELKTWPAVHVIGKDILKFHGIYWPAFLIASGLEPPKKLIVHSHWLVS
jgi:methionyl-tRNA synthetase